MYVSKPERSYRWLVALPIGAIIIAAALIMMRTALFLPREAERLLSKEPAFQQIARWQPEAYEQIKAEVVAGLSQHKSEAQVTARAGAIVLAVANRYMQSASDEALVDYMRISNEQMRETAAKDPDVAYDLLGGRPDVEVERYVDPKTLGQMSKALAEIIRTGVAKEAGYQNNERAKGLLEQIKASMRRDYGPDAMSFQLPHYTPEEWTEISQLKSSRGREDWEWERQVKLYGRYQPVDKRRTCQMVIEFQDRVLALRTDQAASVLRLLFSQAHA